MAGIGKTTLIKEILYDPSVKKEYILRVWVTVGRKCQLKEILLVILAQLDPNKVLMGGVEEIAEYLKKKLKNCARSLIVLDDLWDEQVVHDLRRLFRGTRKNNGIHVFFITTRLQGVARCGWSYKLQLLNKEDSWHLLRNKVFGEEVCPPQLEKVGKKIAKKCEGLPLTIVTVANLLSQVEKTPAFWSQVAARKEHPIFIAAYDEISKVLYPSYEHLIQHLKMCFLYMGVFPQNYEIRKSKLINLWTAEGLLEQNIFQRSEDFIGEWLNELVSNNLVMLYRKCFIWDKMKACKVHSSVWHLCNRIVRKNKFFHVLNNCAHGLEDCIKGQRRLCIHNNTLLGIRKVHTLREDNHAFTSRSLVFWSISPISTANMFWFEVA